jgi:preprotein translocase subunit SecF
MKYRRHAFVLSILLTVVALGSLASQGFTLGLDFTGGMIAELHYSHPVELNDVRQSLSGAGFPEANVQSLGSAADVLIRLPPLVNADATELRKVVLAAVAANAGNVEVRRFETVGPQVGDELAEQGGLAMMFALIGIFVYVTLRFRWKFALGTVIATLHDTIVTLGAFSLFHWEFNLTVLGAVLAVIGYSVNDTIVVYDRIRDNFRLMRRAPAVDIIATSVNQTMSRTMITGLTTLLVVVALLFLGGNALWGFSVALIIGIVVGTYSSIFVASTMALALNVRSEDFLPPPQDPADALP